MSTEVLTAVGWFSRFESALSDIDVGSALSLFAADCYWRDFLAFTWNIATLEGRTEFATMLNARLSGVQPREFRVVETSTGVAANEAWFTFDTAAGRGTGHVRLKDGLCWTLFTALRALDGYEEKSGHSREKGTDHGTAKGRATWLDRRKANHRELGYSRQPYCLVVGGGQGGLALAARLKRLNVPALVIDRLPRTGDTWRNRYRSLCLHDPVWYDHMPYLPFPNHWPIYTPKDKMGDWLESYASIMELDVWNETACRRAEWNQRDMKWQVEVSRQRETVILQPSHLVLATGMAGVPNLPAIPGAEKFRGAQYHSSRYRDGAGFSGKRCVVIGSNNSAHDIAADLWEHDADVTMLQRSPTLVIKSETLEKFGRPLYSEAAVEAGIDADWADLMAASTPYRLMPQFARSFVERVKKEDADFYEQLRAVGFMLTFGEDETGIGLMYARRGSGYYIDVGASDLIADKRVKLRSGVEISHFTEGALVLADRTALPADLVVYATGFGSMNGWAAEPISQDVADKVGPCWGIGSDTAKDPGPWQGELRNMWKPTAQEALWFQGGNLQQARHLSLYLALQIKARMEGLPTPVYQTETGSPGPRSTERVC